MSETRKWNVLVGVIDIIEAATPEQAQDILRAKLESAGFSYYDLAGADTKIHNLIFEHDGGPS